MTVERRTTAVGDSPVSDERRSRRDRRPETDRRAESGRRPETDRRAESNPRPESDRRAGSDGLSDVDRQSAVDRPPRTAGRSTEPRRVTDGGGPLVSVVIPTYHRNDLLPRAIRSALDQTHEPVEVVVVDLSGEAHAEPVVAEFPAVEYVPLDEERSPHRGRNVGFGHTEGAYVQFLDDDDRLLPTKFSRQLAVFETRPAAGVVYCGVDRTDDTTYLPDEEARGDVLDRALTFSLWPCMSSTMLIDRSVAAAIHPFEERPASADLELIVQLARETAFDFVDAPLVCKRVDASSLGRSTEAITGRFGIVDDYAALYDQRPERVRRAAIANTYRAKGRILLQRRRWSAAAVRAFALHVRHRPDPGPKAVAEAAAAVFGRPGMRLAQFLDRRLRSLGRLRLAREG